MGTFRGKPGRNGRACGRQYLRSATCATRSKGPAVPRTGTVLARLAARSEVSGCALRHGTTATLPLRDSRTSDDFDRRALGRADAVPTARLVTRHKFAHGWDVRQYLQTRCGGYCERAQPTSPDILSLARGGSSRNVRRSLGITSGADAGCPRSLVRHAAR
jgi:hypothetical protein